MKLKLENINFSLVLSIALIAIVFIELFFLFQQNPKKNISINNNSNDKVGNYKNPPKTIGFQKMAYYLSLFEDDSILSTQIKVTLQGEIGEVFDTPGIKDTIPYSKGIVLVSKNGKRNSILFRDLEVSKVTVYSGTNRERQILLNELNIGDNVLIYQTFDFNYDKSYNLTNAEVVKF